MLQVHAAGCLRVSSPTIRSIGFRDNSGEKAELVIEDAPRLERLLLPYCHRDDCVTIRVISAPKLEILGPLSPDFCKLLVLYAKVLNKIEFQGCGDYNNELVARQHRLLQVETELLEMLILNSGIFIFVLMNMWRSMSIICHWSTPFQTAIDRVDARRLHRLLHKPVQFLVENTR